uniref:Uncharacterized protein n=1 Tax=Panagrolaimus sp. JU765 TaxID=591449 RepID=A0AC34RR57_9BILA
MTNLKSLIVLIFLTSFEIIEGCTCPDPSLPTCCKKPSVWEDVIKTVVVIVCFVFIGLSCYACCQGGYMGRWCCWGCCGCCYDPCSPTGVVVMPSTVAAPMMTPTVTTPTTVITTPYTTPMILPPC